MKASSGVLAFLLACGPPLGGQVADTTSPEECMRIARAAYLAADYSTALECYRYVVEQHPQCDRAGRAAVNIGYIYGTLRDLGRAEAAFLAVLEAYPQSEYAAEAQTRLGYVALAAGDREKAGRAFSTAAADDPGSPHAAEATLRLGYLALGRLREEMPEAEASLLKEAAADAFSSVLTHPAATPSVASDAYAQYAGIFFEWGMEGSLSMEEVREVCRHVLELFAGGEAEPLATAQLMISETYLQEKRPVDAHREAIEVVERYPQARTQAAFAHWVAGQALEAMEQWPEAILQYDSVLTGPYTEADNFKGRNIHSMCSFRIAQCFRRLGDADSAVTWLRYVIKSWPRSGVARTARRLLWVLPPR